jgi:hypothetical protein
MRTCQEPRIFVHVYSMFNLCATQLGCVVTVAAACASFSRHAARRASWVGDTNKLWRASDAAYSELVGTDADYHHFKRVSGAAAVQRTIKEARALLPRLEPAARAGDAQGAAAPRNDAVATG